MNLQLIFIGMIIFTLILVAFDFWKTQRIMKQLNEATRAAIEAAESDTAL